MSKKVINKRALHIGTAVVWAAVLLVVSFLTEPTEGGGMDWRLMWVVVGGYLIQSFILDKYINSNSAK